MNFYDWLVGNAGVPGEYQYQKMHIITTIIVFLLILFFIILAANKKISDKNKRRILVFIAIFQLTFEISWRLIYLFVKKDSLLSIWPMYPCNLGGIIIPIFALTNFKTGKRMFYLFGFIGGCLTFALPEGIFNTSVFVFPILKSVLQHTGLLIIPIFEYVNKTFKPSIKDYGFIILGCLIHVFNCEVIDRLFGFTGDYIFFRSDMPFVIPNVPQFITLSLFTAIILLILSFILDYNESVAWLKEKKVKMIKSYK